MKVHLERATFAHVQTFAPELEPDERFVAGALGWKSPEAMYADLLERSQEAFAMVAETRVIAMLGVLKGSMPAALWMHMPPVFKEVGFGGLRVARLLIDRLLVDYRELRIDVEVSKAEVVRMADWLGFRVFGTTEKLGRTFHQCALRDWRAIGKARVA